MAKEVTRISKNPATTTVLNSKRDKSDSMIKVIIWPPSPAPLPASASYAPPPPASPVAASLEQQTKGTAAPLLPGWTGSERTTEK